MISSKNPKHKVVLVAMKKINSTPDKTSTIVKKKKKNSKIIFLYINIVRILKNRNMMQSLLEHQLGQD